MLIDTIELVQYLKTENKQKSHISLEYNKAELLNNSHESEKLRNLNIEDKNSERELTIKNNNNRNNDI